MFNRNFLFSLAAISAFTGLAAAQPANDDCGDAQPVAVPSSTQGTTNGAFGDAAPACGTSVETEGVWYSLIGNGNALTAELCTGTFYDSKISVYCGGSCAALVCVDGNDDDCDVQSRVSWCSINNAPYLIFVHGFFGDTGPFTLDIFDDETPCQGMTCVAGPPNDNCNGAIPAVLGPNSFNNASAGNSGVIGNCIDGNKDLFYTYTPSADVAITVTTCDGASFDTTLHIMLSCDGPEIACNDDADDCGLQSRVSACVTGGVPIIIRVGSFGFVGGPGTFTLSESPIDPDDAGDLPATSVPQGQPTIFGQIGSGCGSEDADLFLINICNPANFSASTVGGADFDTALFLFAADGTAIVMNDDEPGGATVQSILSNAFTGSLPPGNYYLAVAPYDKDPLDNTGEEIWLDFPFDAERAPDGIGFSDVLASWNLGESFADGFYIVTLTGTCGFCHGDCVADFDDGSGTGTPDGGVTIEDLLYYLVLFDGGLLCADVDDGSGTGTMDGGVTIDDLLYFLFRFDAGC